jgi:hypothetical protein
LAVYHLRDALSGGDALDTALRRLAPSLLLRFDVDLYTYMSRRDLDVCALLRPAIANWFASIEESPADGAVASRLLDVFLVSHAAMPVYCAVASLVEGRDRLLAGGSGASFRWNMDSIETVERIIAQALQYM